MTLLALILCQAGLAATHTVDAEGTGDFTSIQDAVDAAANGDTIEIAAGTFSENISITSKTLTISGSGTGATFIEGDGSSTVLSASTGGLSLSNFTVTGGGQGVSLQGVVGSLSGVEVDGNSGSEDGGGIAVTDGGDVNLSNVIITNNTGSNGGGVYVDESSKVQVSDTWLEGNAASGSGGAAYSAGNFKLTGSDVIDNMAEDHGGGIFATGLSPQVDENMFRGNEAGGNGGAIAILDTATGAMNPRLKQTEFWINEAGGSGGAIWMSNPGGGTDAFYLKQLLVVLNSAGEDGGGVWISGGGATFHTFLRVWHNTAENDGGGAYFANATGGETRKCSFGGNSAGGVGGGAVHKDPAARHTIYNNRYIENNASDGGGFVIDNDPSKRMPVNNVDVFGNTGGGVSIINSESAKLINSIVSWNDGTGISADEASASGATLKWINTYENETAYGGSLEDLTGTDFDGDDVADNISVDPLYKRAERDGNPISDFLKLTSESPCLNVGSRDLINLDGSRSSLGSYGGPGSEGGDEDGDGVGPVGGDCDDGDAAAAPGLEEVPGDGRDNDCNGGPELDIDEDGSLYPLDCDDEDPDIAPGMPDEPGDGIDSDCDGSDGVVGDDTGTTGDGDGDGDADSDDTGVATGADTGAPWVDEDTGEGIDLDSDIDGDGFTDDDCNDADASAYPGAEEVCDDGVDNDCDGVADANDDDCKAGDKGCGCASTRLPNSLPLISLVLIGLAVRRRE